MSNAPSSHRTWPPVMAGVGQETENYVMHATYHMLVEPRSEAREHFTKVAGDHADLLLESVLLDPEAHLISEVVPLVKLVFLSRIREYDPFKAADSAVEILGSDDISVEVFDRWWTVRELEYDFPFNAMVGLYLAPLVSKVKTHNDVHLAEMIEFYLRKCEQ